MVPGLLIAFNREHERHQQFTFMDIIKEDDVGILFEEVATDVTYRFTGFTVEGFPTCVALGSKDQVQLDPQTKIRRLF